MLDLVVLDNASVHKPIRIQKMKYSHPHSSTRNTKPLLKYGGDYTTKSKEPNTIWYQMWPVCQNYQIPRQCIRLRWLRYAAL